MCLFDMKIEYHKIEGYHPNDVVTLEEFCDRYKLVMEVHERSSPRLPRFYATIRGAEFKEREHFLTGLFGDGDTPQEAIDDYAKEISGKVMVLDAMFSSRREIQVPTLLT